MLLSSALAVSATVPAAVSFAPQAQAEMPCLMWTGVFNSQSTTDCTDREFIGYSATSILEQFLFTVSRYALKGAVAGAGLFVLYQLLFAADIIRRPIVELPTLEQILSAN
ncbi:MAG: hypothetical protein Q3972_02140 [Corynebacterium sp.]|nr:hypothetical protein [Corynebacterium sp.]